MIEEVTTKKAVEKCQKMSPCYICGHRPVLEKKKFTYDMYYRYKCSLCSNVTGWHCGYKLGIPSAEKEWEDTNGGG